MKAPDSRPGPVAPEERGAVFSIYSSSQEGLVLRSKSLMMGVVNSQEYTLVKVWRKVVVEKKGPIEALAEAAQAGMAFAKSESGATGGSIDKNAIKEFAADLAVTIVLALRKRITADTAGDGAERANAAYKEWRGARVERLCTDAARRAFHLGIVSAAQGGQVRFYVSPNDAPCDACASDSRAGEIQAGKTFPSGAKHPPLHAGCACAVIPV